MVLLFQASFAGAQELNLSREQEDTLHYVRSYPGKFNLRLILQERPMFLQLRNGESSLEYRPNTRSMIGFGANILRVGLSFTFQMPDRFARDEAEFGDTDFKDYQIGFFVNNFLMNLRYQDYSGFYLDNTADWEDRYFFAERPLHKDLAMRKIKISSIYIVNPDRLTLRIYNNSQRQVRGAGSFTVMSVLNHFRIKSDSLVIQPEFKAHYSKSAWLRQGHFTGFGLLPGYSHNFIVENFYLNLTVAAGPELQYRHYNSASGSDAGIYIQGKINIMGAVGYDNDVFFAGLHFVDQRSRYNAGGLQILHDTGFMRLSIGHRFQETGWMKKIREWRPYKWVMNLI